ncbi:hypothetical protein AAL_02371 [Moelleriella libera RCEF 2490]|uniref:Uncharacterized protein n=1 Tax=Moelleriella libera RCEF 2490 TaxID=1081109 RepID=A0A166PSX7_9HYPO|nr:hypothetical protein AAL_02371 [Moelleriella libera RCEF 2490]
MTIVLAICTIQCQVHLLRLTPTELSEVSESGREEYAIFAVVALANGPDRRLDLGKQKTVKFRQISDLLKSFVRADKRPNFNSPFSANMMLTVVLLQTVLAFMVAAMPTPSPKNFEADALLRVGPVSESSYASESPLSRRANFEADSLLAVGEVHESSYAGTEDKRAVFEADSLLHIGPDAESSYAQ